MPFERNWLAGSLAKAAENAGYKKWWLAPHVTESVTNYLEKDFDESVVTINRLEKAVQSVLQVIGYADVAGHFHAAPPPARQSESLGEGSISKNATGVDSSAQGVGLADLFRDRRKGGGDGHRCQHALSRGPLLLLFGASALGATKARHGQLFTARPRSPALALAPRRRATAERRATACLHRLVCVCAFSAATSPRPPL